VGQGPKSPAQIMREGYAAWNTGDIETFLELVHPEVDWITSGVFPGLRARYHGHDGMREFWREFVDPWEKLEIEPEEFRELTAESVLARLRFHAHGRDGMEVDLEFTNHALIRDGMLFRFQGYGDWDEALADLGIEDSR
jgi:ketosteroid isomerase-like protein